MTDERIYKRCSWCGSEFAEELRYSCPHCSVMFSSRGPVYVRTERWHDPYRWYAPWTWGKGEWRTTAQSEVAALEEMYRR